MTALVETLLMAGAAYRLWRLVGVDDITEWFRDRLWPWPHKLITCPWCMGSWIAFGVAAVSWWAGWISGPVVLEALTAAAIVGWVGERI